MRRECDGQPWRSPPRLHWALRADYGQARYVNGQLQETNHRLGSIEQGKLASMDSQLRETNQRLASVERQLAATNDKLETLEGAVKAIPGLDPKD